MKEVTVITVMEVTEHYTVSDEEYELTHRSREDRADFDKYYSESVKETLGADLVKVNSQKEFVREV